MPEHNKKLQCKEKRQCAVNCTTYGTGFCSQKQMLTLSFCCKYNSIQIFSTKAHASDFFTVTARMFEFRAYINLTDFPNTPLACDNELMKDLAPAVIG